MATQRHKMVAAGTAALIAEPALALAHTGGLGVLVGLALGIVAYHAVDDVERMTGRNLASLPVSLKNQGEMSLAKRLLVGKSAREPQGNETQPLDDPSVPGGTEQALQDAESAHAKEGITHYVTDDPSFALYLGANFAPDVNMVLTEGVFCSGMKGSGKTQVAARISEQIGRFPDAAQVVFDSQGDLLSLTTMWPNGRVIDAQHWYSAEQIITQRLQVVVNLRTWQGSEARAQAIAALTRDLVEYAESLPHDERIPCPVFLDEAQYWLPENPVQYLSIEVQKELSDRFNMLVDIGRKLGLPPFIFTQRIARVQKGVVTCGVQIFMRVALDNDATRCKEYVRASVMKKEGFFALTPGQGVVTLPGGIQLLVQFDERKSLHVSHAPKVSSPDAASPTRRLPETPAPRVIPEQRAYIPQSPAATRRLPEPEAIRMPRPQSRPSPVLSPRLQKALEAYQNGHTSSRSLGEALGFKKDVGADVIRQLRERRLID